MTPVDKMSCEKVVVELWPHLDGLLPDSERDRVTRHLMECTECRSHFDFARAFLEAVAATRPEVKDDGALRARLFSALSAEGFRG